MRSYLAITGTVFGLITVAHVWRVFVEGPALAKEPWFVLLTVVTAILSIWAWRLFTISARR